jgi:hypothetical protein
MSETPEQAGSAAVGGTPGPGNETGPDPDCDVHGFWVGRLTTFSRDTVFNSVQTASNWFFFEFAQTGPDFHVATGLNCGIRVSGSADVTINGATTRALIHFNEQAGRKGQSYREGDHCVFRMDRFYSVRGVPRAAYLPQDLSSKPELSAIKPALPTEMMTMGAEDTDKDGELGIAYQVSGLGSRSVVQRDWNEWSSMNIALSPREVVAPANFDNQEEILSVSGGLGALLRAGSAPARDLNHRFTMRLLGRNAGDAEVTKVRVTDDLDTCFNVQDALPHDAAMK